MSLNSKISVLVTANTVKFDRKMKDVKRELKDTGAAFKKFGAQLKSVTKGFAAVGAVGAGFAAAGAVIVKSSADQVKELKTLSTVAGTTVAELQRGAFAARQFGVEQQEYAQALKDVNDRVGDFLTTGAGPMVDFFEKIGPKVGVTADAFKGLNSEEALGLYVKSLEDANVSQQEMTFFMEAIAGDATKLIPLFTQNAAALKQYKEEAKQLGIGLSEIDVTKILEAEKTMGALGSVISGQVNVAVAELAPFITAALESLVDFVSASGGIRNIMIPALRSIVKTVGFVVDAFRGIGLVFKTLRVGFLTFTSLISTVWYQTVDGIVTGINSVVKKAGSMFKKVADMARPLNEELANTFDSMAESINDASIETPRVLKDLMNSQVEALKEGVKDIHNTLEEKPASVAYVETLDKMIEKGKEQQAQAEALAEAEKAAREKANDSTGGSQGADLSNFDLGELKKDSDRYIALLENRYQVIEEKDLTHIKKLQDQLVAAKDAGLITTAQFNKEYEKLAQPRKLMNFDFEEYKAETARLIEQVRARGDEVTGAEIEAVYKRKELIAAAEEAGLVSEEEAEGQTQQIDAAVASTDLQNYQQETIGLIEAMGFRFETQQEMQAAADARELEMLQKQLENKRISIEEYERKTAEIQRRSEEVKRQNLQNHLQSGFQLLAQNSSKVGKLMKGVAIAQAIIKGKESAVSAWAAGMSTGGPFAPVVAAAYTAASLAKTGAMIKAIKSSGKSAGGGGAVAAPAVPTGGGGGGGGGGPAQPSRVFNVDFAGSSQTSTEQTRNLLELINEQAGDNVEINLRGA